MKKHKVLLLGMGFWGRRWLELILKTERCQLAGVAGSEPEMRQVQETYGVDSRLTFTDFREAIRQTDAEIAVVVLPGVLHFEADKMILEKGMSLITEKPLAMNMEEAETLLELKRKHPGQLVMTSQNYRWRPHNQAIKQAIEAGKIGKIQSVLLEFRQQEDLQGYRSTLEMPLLQDVSIHHYDLLRFFTGADCESVYCRTWRPDWSLFDGKPNTEAILTMSGGITVTYEGSWAARGKETSWDGNFTITGEKGCLTLDVDNKVRFYPHRKTAQVVLDMQSQQGEEIPVPKMQYCEMEYGFHMFMDCLENKVAPETALEDNIKSFAMVMASLESVRRGEKVDCGQFLSRAGKMEE